MALQARERINHQYHLWQQWGEAHRHELIARIAQLSVATPADDNPQPPPMREAELMELVSFYSDEQPIECPVCLGDISIDDALLSLICGNDGAGPPHRCHLFCAMDWVTKHHASCPLCRTAIDRIIGRNIRFDK